jgi:cytochrome P450
MMVLLEPLFLSYRRHFPKARSPIFQKERKQLEKIIAPIMGHRRGTGTKDILSLILNARNDEDKPLTDDEVRNEIVTFMLAGHETTATALTWTLYLLAQNPLAAARMYEELDSVLGHKPAGLEDMQRLPYTSAVFQEGMRLYPPALAFARRAKEPVELAGYTVPKGASVFLSPYITQRNHRYYDEPEVFRPERWLQSERAKFSYFPFGGGAKMCIGESFARLEGVLALSCIGRNWRLSCSNRDSVEIGVGMLLQPDRGILLLVSERTQVSQEAPTI